MEIVLENLSSQDLVTYIPSDETIVPLNLYENYINEAPQVIYTTLHSLNGIDYTNQMNFYPCKDEGKNRKVYKTNFDLNQIPFVEGQYYILVHSKLEKTELISCEYGLGTTCAAIGFWDPAGYQIGSQFFWTEEKGDYLFTLDDLEISDGFELIENFEPFVIPDKDFRTIDYLVNSQNPTLATIYASQKADIPQALTINYWTKDWDLVDSETEPIDIAFGQGGYPTILLGTDFSVDVPEG